MKKFLIFIIVLCSVKVFSQQESPNIRYDFKYVYYVITDRKSNKDNIIPTGTNCVVNYNKFYKKYFIGWTDQKGISAGTYFYYIPSKLEKENVIMSKDDNGGKYVIQNTVNTKGIMTLTILEPHSEKYSMKIVLANKEL